MDNKQVLESMKEELRVLAKRANQRMVRIEKSEKLSEKSSSYLNVQTFLRSQSAKKKRISSERFVDVKSTMDKMSEAEIQSQIIRAKKFLEAKSSTKTGIKKIEKNKIIGLQNKLKEIDKDITYNKAKSLGDFFGEMEKRGLYKKKGKSELDSEEVISKFYKIEDLGYEYEPDEVIKNVKTYEDALKMNKLFNKEIFNLKDFEEEEEDDEEYEENF